jgi:hypothetical protein
MQILKQLNSPALATAVFAGVLLSACGGGSEVPVPLVNGTQVPVSATQSGSASLAYVAQVVASPAAAANSAEPVVVGDAQLANDDTAEPAPL